MNEAHKNDAHTLSTLPHLCPSPSAMELCYHTRSRRKKRALSAETSKTGNASIQTVIFSRVLRVLTHQNYIRSGWFLPHASNFAATVHKNKVLTRGSSIPSKLGITRLPAIEHTFRSFVIDTLTFAS